MKTRGLLLITLILIFLSGCIETKVYLGREDPGDETEQVYGAINPTTIPAGITWGTFRTYINDNFEEVDLAIDTLDNGLADAIDSITALRTAIELRLLKSDSTIFASRHELVTGLAGKQDTLSLKTINGEPIEGTGDITITGTGAAWGEITGTLADQDDLSDALAAKQDSSSKLDAIVALADGSGQLTNDGSGNLSWVATGGTGTVTSVGLSAPLGFNVTNSPITTNGNISLDFTTGYSLPMTEDQVNWSSAYDWVTKNGLLSISGLHSLIFRTTGSTDVTLPTTGTLATTSDVTNEVDTRIATGKKLSDVAPLLIDTIPHFVFGAGQGEAADSIAFAKGKKGFGCFNVVTDSLRIVNVDNLYISANDSLKFNIYYGNRMTSTVVDSLFTGPQSLGDNQTTFTPNNVTTIPPGYDVWVGLTADQPTGYRPKEWYLQLNAYKIRD